MTTRLPSKDIETLSAYLDGHLGDSEQITLEARLQTDPRLRHALDSLKTAISALRSLPALPVPRTFTLTPEMVPSRPAIDLFPLMRFASAAASILLVLVLVGDFAYSSRFGFAGAPAESFALEAADQVAADSAPAGGADTAGEGEAAAELIAPAAEEPQEEAELTQAADAAAAGALADDASPQATPTVPALEAAGTLPAGPDERTTATEIQPSPEAPDSDAGQLFQTGPAPAAGLRFSPLAVVEILLAATAVGTGVTALVLRRRR